MLSLQGRFSESTLRYCVTILYRFYPVLLFHLYSNYFIGVGNFLKKKALTFIEQILKQDRK